MKTTGPGYGPAGKGNCNAPMPSGYKGFCVLLLGHEAPHRLLNNIWLDEEPPAQPKPYLVHWLKHQYPPIRWPWMRWVVAMQGKKSVWFEHHTVALAFALYAARCPQVMQDAAPATVSMKTAYANLNEDGSITVHGIQR